MRKWPLLLVIMLLSLWGCKPSDRKTRPDNLIPRDVMISLMSDVEVVEARLRFQQTRITQDSLNKIKTKNYDSLYMFYKVTPDQFKQNLSYYQGDLENFERMMDEIILSITRSRDSVLNIKKMSVDSTAVFSDSTTVIADSAKLE